MANSKILIATITFALTIGVVVFILYLINIDTTQNPITPASTNLSHIAPEYLQIISQSTLLPTDDKYCLTVYGGRDDILTPITVEQCYGGDNQLWKYDGITFQLNPKLSINRCLDTQKGKEEDKIPLVLDDCDNKKPSQRWIYDDKTNQLSLQQSDETQIPKCIDFIGNGDAAITKTILNECDSSFSNQAWTFEDISKLLRTIPGVGYKVQV
jgi:hypothetical protein